MAKRMFNIYTDDKGCSNLSKVNYQKLYNVEKPKTKLIETLPNTPNDMPLNNYYEISFEECLFQGKIRKHRKRQYCPYHVSKPLDDK